MVTLRQRLRRESTLRWDEFGEKNMTDVLQRPSEELSLAHSQRHIDILQQRESFIDVLYMVIELSRKDQYVFQLDGECLKRTSRKN